MGPLRRHGERLSRLAKPSRTARRRADEERISCQPSASGEESIPSLRGQSSCFPVAGWIARPTIAATSPINAFLLENSLRIAGNPCISPDFCLDWKTLCARLKSGAKPAESPIRHYPNSRFATAAGAWELIEDGLGDHAWILEPVKGKGAKAGELLGDGVALSEGRWAFPATWANLLALKTLVIEHDAESTIFPAARGSLATSSIGVGARFTTLHWPAVEWAMAALGTSLTANQNSIPRELVYDVDEMLAGRLARVPFPFIGGDVPEGHQGQSVEGMSHGAVLSKLKTGFHRHRLPWGFNADHQPVGGAFDAREDRLVAGCLLASYITFDLSPELAATTPPAKPAAWVAEHVAAAIVAKVKARVAEVGVKLKESELADLLARVWPAMIKMQVRDRKYAAARAQAFAAAGRAYFRELSIDELPGLTTPETLATMLSLCEALEVPVQFVAPAFGFQKNFPFADQKELEKRVSAAWKICERFGVSIGFHSGSGKSEENYRLVGRITGGRLEIKTSGRYTYEMGVALSRSNHPIDQQLWKDWYGFAKELSLRCAFSTNETERSMARQFIAHALTLEGRHAEVFSSTASCRSALEALYPSPDHMFWFEYNFLFVLAAHGHADKASLGDHGPAGYRQRARFYAISDQGRLRFARGVAAYVVLLCETTGLAKPEICATATKKLATYTTYEQMIADIAPAEAARKA